MHRVLELAVLVWWCVFVMVNHRVFHAVDDHHKHAHPAPRRARI